MAAVAGHVIEVLLCQFLHKRRRSTITNHAAGGTANANSSSLRNRRNVDTMCAAASCVLICKMSGSKFKSGKTNTKGSETQWLEIFKRRGLVILLRAEIWKMVANLERCNRVQPKIPNSVSGFVLAVEASPECKPSGSLLHRDHGHTVLITLGLRRLP